MLSLDAWHASGRTVEVFGRRVFVRDTGGDGPVLAVLHGFPSASYDFHAALPTLADRFRVVLHDHVGFGFSEKPVDTSYSLLEQAEVALAVWKALGIGRAHLLAHDYGTSVATEILARRERGGIGTEIDSLTLCNGSVHVELARLRTAQKLLRHPWTGPLLAQLSNEAYFVRNMRAIVAKPVDDSEWRALWTLLERDDGRARLPAISGYLDERVRFRHRWVGALTRWDRPSQVLWGRRDPVAVPAIAEALAAEIPGARLTWLEELGHYPMLEDPETWARAAVDGVFG